MVLLDVSIKRHAKVVIISLKGVRQKRYLHFLCCSVVIDKKSWFQLLLVLLLLKEGQVKGAVFPTLISFVVTRVWLDVSSVLSSGCMMSFQGP